MEYAMQLLVPILGGLLLGYWLHQEFGVSAVWTIVLAVLGMFAGLGIMYKRSMYPNLYHQPESRPRPTPDERPTPKLPWDDDTFRLDEGLDEIEYEEGDDDQPPTSHS